MHVQRVYEIISSKIAIRKNLDPRKFSATVEPLYNGHLKFGDQHFVRYSIDISVRLLDMEATPHMKEA